MLAPGPPAPDPQGARFLPATARRFPARDFLSPGMLLGHHVTTRWEIGPGDSPSAPSVDQQDGSSLPLSLPFAPLQSQQQPRKGVGGTEIRNLAQGRGHFLCQHRLLPQLLLGRWESSHQAHPSGQKAADVLWRRRRLQLGKWHLLMRN